MWREGWKERKRTHLGLVDVALVVATRGDAVGRFLGGALVALGLEGASDAIEGAFSLSMKSGKGRGKMVSSPSSSEWA